MSYGPPPRKRARLGFTIDELLELQEHQQSGSGPSHPSASPTTLGNGLDAYVMKLDEDVEHAPRFTMTKVKSKFMIKDLPADPEALLSEIFQKCIDEAVDESKQHGHTPDRLGCMISSELLNPDIWTPIREITDNTTDVILNRLLSTAQSKKKNGVSLLGAPFIVSITTVSRKELPTKHKLTGGARRMPPPIHHQINEKALIKVSKVGSSNNHCLFYALQISLVHRVGNWTRNDFLRYKNSEFGFRGKFERDTEELMRQVAAPFFQSGYEAEKWVPRVVDFWNNVRYAGRHVIKVFIFGESGRYKPLFKYGPENYNVSLLLYFNNNHFDGVRRDGRLFGKPYCLSCEKVYDKASTHTITCRARCSLCGRVGIGFPCPADRDGYYKYCGNCQKVFTSVNCYHHHVRSNFCKRSKLCRKCGVIWDVKDNTKNGRTGHECDERFCTVCNAYHNKKRGCFIKPLEPMWEMPYRIVSFDLETMQHIVVNPGAPPEQQKRQHQPNFIAAKVACPDCINSGKWRNSLKGSACDVCGPHRTITFNQFPFNATEVDFQVVTPNPLKHFVEWILYCLPSKYDTIAFSHFGGRFDMVLVFKELFNMGFSPEMIRKGNKMFEMKIKRQKKDNYHQTEEQKQQQQPTHPAVIFRDSFNLMPNSLSTLVPTFGLDVVEKPFFPHLVNRPDNYDLFVFPEKADYLADGMMPAKRQEFDQWYSLNKQYPFRLEEALASYCTNDVEILMSALVAFRTEFNEVTCRQADAFGNVNRAASKEPHGGIDVLRTSMTIAAASMRHFKTNHLKSGHLAIVPERGYDNADNQSLVAHKYLQWYSEKNKVTIRTAHSADREKSFGRYQVDGWIESIGKAIEVNGCVWHGCPKCFPLDEQMLPNGRTSGWTRQQDAARLEFISSQVKQVEVVWECEIYKMLEKDKEMRDKFDRYRDAGPLNIRDCFMGGRCGPRKMFQAVQPGKKISYYDVTSLYPFINATTNYPVGHPKVHVLNKDVNWTSAADNPFPLALMKVLVIPPRSIDIPVLPLKADDRLVFGLCYTCTREFPNGGVQHGYSCCHGDEDRSWVSSCTSIELNAALDEGYRVIKLYRVLEYTESDNKLFQPYIAEFMAQKIHASGFSSDIKGNEEAEQQFVDECLERFGIKIEKEKMKLNKGKRALAKLALNNLWGRFSMRNFELSKTFITSDPVDVSEFLDDRSVEVTAMDQLNDKTILLSYLVKKEWIEEHGCSNIVVSLWTTSAARLYLLKLMQRVVRSGSDLLYTDTDSVIHMHDEAANPLSLGAHLGDLTDEYPDHEILEFTCGGAKQYGLKLRRKDTGKIEHVLKLRGITLNYDVTVNQNLQYTAFRERVLQYAENRDVEPISVFNPCAIRPNIKKAHLFHPPVQEVQADRNGPPLWLDALLRSERTGDASEFDDGRISQGRFEFNANLFMDQIPRRITLGLVANSDYVGDPRRSPFNFQPFNVREISIIANGRAFPQAPYDLDYPRRKYVRAFNDMNEAVGFSNTTEGNGITYAQFGTTHCIYVFNMTNSGDDQPGLFDLIRNGTTAVSIKFNEGVPAGGIVLVVMGECDSLVMLDKNRSISTDTTI
ncbi:hypothetical protein niasHT_009844 [Heterodera trifolii]|uniref:DNA-directed DNA polymerase n=1 Tax=Heterodera trifolii TaxID=157864 RepID=A0ABD2LRD7_9BILA